MMASRSRMLCSSSTTSTRMSGIRGRERDGERAAQAWAAVDVDLAAVVLHDAVHQGEAEPATVGLGGEEGLEDVAEVGGLDPLSGVAHAQHETAPGGHRHPQLA